MIERLDPKTTASDRIASLADAKLAPYAGRLADRLDRLALALGGSLRGLDGALGGRVDDLTRTTREAAEYVRTANARRLLADGELLVRRRPRTSASLLFSAGFLATRYLRARSEGAR